MIAHQEAGLRAALGERQQPLDDAARIGPAVDQVAEEDMLGLRRRAARAGRPRRSGRAAGRAGRAGRECRRSHRRADPVGHLVARGLRPRDEVEQGLDGHVFGSCDPGGRAHQIGRARATSIARRPPRALIGRAGASIRAIDSSSAGGSRLSDEWIWAAMIVAVPLVVFGSTEAVALVGGGGSALARRPKERRATPRRAD